MSPISAVNIIIQYVTRLEYKFVHLKNPLATVENCKNLMH